MSKNICYIYLLPLVNRQCVVSKILISPTMLKFTPTVLAPLYRCENFLVIYLKEVVHCVGRLHTHTQRMSWKIMNLTYSIGIINLCIYQLATLWSKLLWFSLSFLFHLFLRKRTLYGKESTALDLWSKRYTRCFASKDQIEQGSSGQRGQPHISEGGGRGQDTPKQFPEGTCGSPEIKP